MEIIDRRSVKRESDFLSRELVFSGLIRKNLKNSCVSFTFGNINADKKLKFGFGLFHINLST